MITILSIIFKYIIFTLLGEENLIHNVGNAIFHLHNAKEALRFIYMVIFEPFNNAYWCIHDCFIVRPISLIVLTIIIVVLVIKKSKIKNKILAKRKLVIE